MENILKRKLNAECRDSSVGTATEYGLDGRGSIPSGGKRVFSTP
jgi:hypothetical protein